MVVRPQRAAGTGIAVVPISASRRPGRMSAWKSSTSGHSPRCGRVQAAPSNRPGSQSTQWDARRPDPAATGSRWWSEEITSSTLTAAPVRLIARNSTRAGLQFSRWARLSHPKMDHRTAHVSKQRTVKLYRMASKSADWPTFGPCTQAGRDRSAPGTPRCQTVSTSGGGEPVNAYVIAMDTAAAVALAALAAGLIIAGRRGPARALPRADRLAALPAASSCGLAPSDLHTGHAARPHPGAAPDRPRQETPRY